MSKTTNISIRMDSDLKNAAEKLFDELGLNISTAFNIFIRQALREQGIPFAITTDVPNQQTVKAIIEAEKMLKDTSVEGSYDVELVLEELKNE